MSLIDPATPEGFFHLRLLPFRTRMLEENKSFFPSHPDSSKTSYFEPPLTSEAADRVTTSPAMLTARSLIQELRTRWANEGESALVEMTEPLEDLRRHVVTKSSDDEEGDEVSDFVYPLF